MIKEIIKSTINIKKITLAIVAAPSEIPPKPKIAATIATIIKMIVHFNITLDFNY